MKKFRVVAISKGNIPSAGMHVVFQQFHVQGWFPGAIYLQNYQLTGPTHMYMWKCI